MSGNWQIAECGAGSAVAVVTAGDLEVRRGWPHSTGSCTHAPAQKETELASTLRARDGNHPFTGRCSIEEDKQSGSMESPGG